MSMMRGGTGDGLSGALDCGATRDLLPLRPTLGNEDQRELEDHLEKCDECRAESDFVARLQDLQPQPPADLADRIVSRYLETGMGPCLDRASEAASGPVTRGRSIPFWMSAAAAAVVALGVGLLWTPPGASDSVWELALDPEGPAWHEEAWLGEEWLVAGGPVPDALPDDVLELLLEEME